MSDRISVGGDRSKKVISAVFPYPKNVWRSNSEFSRYTFAYSCDNFLCTTRFAIYKYFLDLFGWNMRLAVASRSSLM